MTASSKTSTYCPAVSPFKEFSWISDSGNGDPFGTSKVYRSTKYILANEHVLRAFMGSSEHLLDV